MGEFDFTDEEIVKALKICAVSDGSICCYYAYSKIPGNGCSKLLLKDAAERLECLSKDKKVENHD